MEGLFPRDYSPILAMPSKLTGSRAHRQGGFAGEAGLRSQVQGEETGRAKAVHRAAGERRAAFRTGPIWRDIIVHHLLLGKLRRSVTGYLKNVPGETPALRSAAPSIRGCGFAGLSSPASSLLDEPVRILGDTKDDHNEFKTNTAPKNADQENDWRHDERRQEYNRVVRH